MGSRRHPLEGQQPLVVGGVAIASGVLAAVAGLEPTGSGVIDAVLVFVAAAAATWASATAAWWTVAVACGIAMAAAGGPVLVGVALAGLVGAFVIGAKRMNVPWARSLVAAVAVQVLARLEVHGFLGFSAIVACTTLSVLFVLGVRRRPRPVRRRVWWGLGGLGIATLLSLAGLGVAGLSARAPIEDGNRQAQDGLDLLRDGRIPEAAVALRSAADAFATADDHLSAWWAQPSRLIPGVAQQRAGGTALTAGAVTTLSVAADALSQVDPQKIRVVGGRIDVAAVRGLQTPFADLDAAISDLDELITGLDSVWLAQPIKDRLADLSGEIADNRRTLDNAKLAVDLAPALLGGDEPRHYFIAFTTPSEARGLGGFMGNWAELTIDQGRISLSEFGRHTDLTTGGADPDNRQIDMPREFLDHWGQYGFLQDDGTASAGVWSNITMPPDFPSVGEVISQLYPQSGGKRLDGVFMLDPEAIAALVGYTGSIQVTGAAAPLTGENIADFIERDQYLIEQQGERVDLLEEIARTVVARLLAGGLPEPSELARTFGPLAREGRFAAWSADADEEALFRQVNMAGAFPTLDGGDGIAVTIDNGGGNKMDAYLDLSVDYAATFDATTGATTSTATVTLVNDVPDRALPDDVTGNAVELPERTNRAIVTVFSGLPSTAATVDGAPVQLGIGPTFGWTSAVVVVDIPPGQTRTLVVEFAGSLTPGEYHVATRVQPLGTVQPYTTSVS